MGSHRGRCGGGRPEPELVTLVIPQFLQNALGCFSAEPDADVSHLHKIALLSPMQESLYVNNEQDLKDALRQYCLYKQLCEKVDGEMKMLHLEFQLSENSIRLVRAGTAAKPDEIGGTPDAKSNVPPASVGKGATPAKSATPATKDAISTKDAIPTKGAASTKDAISTKGAASTKDVTSVAGQEGEVVPTAPRTCGAPCRENKEMQAQMRQRPPCQERRHRDAEESSCCTIL